MSNESQYYTVKEICTYFSVSTETVYRWIDSGKLKAFRIGGKGSTIRIHKDDLEEFKTTYDSRNR